MIYLALNIVFASAFMLSIKWVQIRKKEDIITVGAINYIAAAVLIAPEFLGNDVSHITLSAAIVGGTMGTCYFICYFLVCFAIKWIGASSSTVIAVLSIVLPILCGIVIWHERPSPFQFVGVVLALCALALIGSRPKEFVPVQRPWFTPWILILFFLLAGSARLAQEAFKHECLPAERPTFLFVAFVCAAIPSLILLVYRRKKISLLEFLFGFGLGSANMLQTHFILKSLQYFDGFVVFPVTSAGGLLLTTVVATRLMHEKLTGRTYLGIACAVIALFLLNWLPDFEPG